MVVRWLFAVEKDVTGLVRSKQALQAAIRGGGRVVLVVNTRSRKGRRHWPGLSARLAAAGLPVQAAFPVHDPVQLSQVLTQALEPAPDLLIFGGGDGSLTAAAGRLAHRDTALGVLPLGTTNNFARSLGLPHRLKRVLGRGAYTLTAARRLASHQAFKATLRVDGAEQVVWTHQLNVANGGYHTGRRIARDAGVDDRLLVVYRLGDAGRLQVTGQTVRQVVVGPRRPLADGPYVMTREVWVDTDPALALDLDGEVRGTTPVRIVLLPQALRVLVPPTFADT
jgi:diacylglycerol kinase (ATP)